MFIDNRLSTSNIPSMIIGARSMGGSLREDYESGPIAVSDPSHGIDYQVWRAVATDTGIKIESANTALTQVITATDVTECSMTFDQGGHPTIAYVSYARTYLFWYDTTISAIATIDFGTSYRCPKVLLDDKRELQSSSSDIIFGYIRGTNLCYRQQRDRYTVERVLATNVTGRLLKLGMGKNWRLQFVVGNY